MRMISYDVDTQKEFGDTFQPTMGEANLFNIGRTQIKFKQSNIIN